MIEIKTPRYSCGISLPAPLAKRIKQYAHDSWRSMSQEIVMRLETSEKKATPDVILEVVKEQTAAINELIRTLKKEK